MARHLANIIADMMANILRGRFAANYFSTLAFVGVAYWIITDLSPFHRQALQGQWHLGGIGIDLAIRIHPLIVTLIALYAVVLIPFYARYPWL